MNYDQLGGEALKKKKIVAGAAFCVLMANPYAAFAESERTFELEPVVVTATKSVRNVKDVSAAVQVITKEEMEDIGATSLPEALSLATGLQMTGSQGLSKKSVYIRGFDSRFSMIMIDGRRLASEPDQAFELGRVPISNIERIEIIRGPQSALYGTEALGGIVNIITKNPKEQSVEINLSKGFYGHDSAETGNYDFSFNSGQVGRFRYSLYASYRENDVMYRNNGYTFSPYGYHRNFGGSMEYDLSKTEVLRFDMSQASERTHEIASTQNANFKTRDDNRRNEYSFSYTKKTDDTELFFRYYHGVLHKNIDQLNKNRGGLFGPTAWQKTERTMRAVEGRLTRKLSDAHTVTLGAEYRPEKFSGTAVNTGKGQHIVHHPTGSSKMASTAWLDYLGIYVQDEWKMSEKFRMITALRYDDNNKFGSDWSPKLGLIYSFDDNSRLKINATRAFRSPTPNQLYQIAPNIGNPGLQSEKSSSYDISYEKELSRSSYKVSYFYNNISNLIDIDSTNTYYNINKARIQGIEAEYVTKLNANWSWTNSYTYLDAMDKTRDTRLRNRARNFVSSRFTYKDNKNFTASLWANFYHDYLPANDVTIANHSARSYLTLNMSASYALGQNTKLVLTAYNIFDKRDNDALEMGRYIQTSVQFKF